MVRREKTSGNAGDSENLVVTAQSSRFHSEAHDESSGREISIKDLNISIRNHELISHAELRIQSGRHYVLIGRNGTGKSALLQAIAGGHIPSIPRSVRIHLLGQVQIHSEDEVANKRNETVLEHVVHSDKDRERLLQEGRRLATATSSKDGPVAIVRAYREIIKERRERDLFDARQVATKLSGARGANARKIVLTMEKEMQDLQVRLATLDTNEIDPTTSADFDEDVQKASELLAEIQSSLDQMSASSAEANAKSILLGLGFSIDSFDKPISQLSGGWRTRCDLACVLWQAADVVLLDEPTNFLDLPSIIWLERYIQSLSNTSMIVVTHDRAFADHVADELLVLRNLVLEKFRGNLSEYEVARVKTYKYMSRMKDAQEKQKKHIQSSIANNLKAAQRTGDDKKLKQVASRKKKLDERMGMEVSAKGTRFKLNRDHGGFHLTLRGEIDVPTFDPPPRIAFSTSPPDLRFPGALISFEKVTFAYGKRDAPILENIDLTIHLGDRVGLVGLNGSGKSTMVALAVAESKESGSSKASLRSGTITRHPRVRIGHYSQRAVEELSEIASAKPELTALSHLLEHTDAELAEKDARAMLAGLGLQGRTTEVPLAMLSGGQKVRLALAKLLAMPPHLLILDEVTTHLDSDTIQALAFALRRYEGALWVVTHDRFFMRCVIEGESPKAMLNSAKDELDEEEESESSEDEGFAKPGVVYRLLKRKMTKLDGGMQQYEARATKASMQMRAK